MALIIQWARPFPKDFLERGQKTRKFFDAEGKELNHANCDVLCFEVNHDFRSLLRCMSSVLTVGPGQLLRIQDDIKQTSLEEVLDGDEL